MTITEATRASSDHLPPEFLAHLREVYSCPDWCRRDPGHHQTELRLSDSRAVVDHDGPDFGPFLAQGETYAETGESAGVSVTVDDSLETCEGITPEELREVAAQALAAAEWLEARA